MHGANFLHQLFAHVCLKRAFFSCIHVTIYLKKTPHEFVQLPLTYQGSRTLTLAETENV